MIDLSSSFFEYYKDFQNLLEERLIKYGVEKDLVSKAVSSGYYMFPSNEGVFDSYYSPSWIFQGHMPFDSFVDMLVKNEINRMIRILAE